MTHITLREIDHDRTLIYDPTTPTTANKEYHGILVNENNIPCSLNLDYLDYDKRIYIRLYDNKMLKTTPIVLRVVTENDEIVSVTTQAGTTYVFTVNDNKHE